MSDVPRETELSARYSQIPGMQAFADILATRGVERGLIGPREVPRLWSRHLVNCAVVAEEATDADPAGQHSGRRGFRRGPPGLVWALVRPDLHVTVIEPLLRRATFLSEAVDRVVPRGARGGPAGHRAEDVAPRTFDVVTARAVAQTPPAAQLDASLDAASVGWSWPSRDPVRPRRLRRPRRHASRWERGRSRFTGSGWAPSNRPRQWSWFRGSGDGGRGGGRRHSAPTPPRCAE